MYSSPLSSPFRSPSPEFHGDPAYSVRRYACQLGVFSCEFSPTDALCLRAERTLVNDVTPCVSVISLPEAKIFLANTAPSVGWAFWTVHSFSPIDTGKYIFWCMNLLPRVSMINLPDARVFFVGGCRVAVFKPWNFRECSNRGFSLSFKFPQLSSKGSFFVAGRSASEIPQTWTQRRSGQNSKLGCTLLRKRSS